MSNPLSSSIDSRWSLELTAMESLIVTKLWIMQKLASTVFLSDYYCCGFQKRKVFSAIADKENGWSTQTPWKLDNYTGRSSRREGQEFLPIQHVK